MPFKKNDPNINRKGRTPGIPNKNSAELRDMVQLLVEQKYDHFSEWIDRVAVDNPAEAFKLSAGLIAYCVPKLNATSIGVDADEDVTWNISFGTDKD